MYHDIDSALLSSSQLLNTLLILGLATAGRKKSKASDYLYKKKIAPEICRCAESTAFHLWFSIKEGYSSIMNGPMEGKDNNVNALVTSKTTLSKYPV